LLAQGSTHLGQRENNEDFFLVDLERNLFIVADGMGGHRAGEIASALAVKAVKEYLSNIPGINAAAAIREAVQAANYQVFVHASLEDALEGMGTTLTVLWIVGRTGYVAHVGDSRAYLIRDGAIDRITCDHSLVQEMVENGGLSEYEARIHPQRNILTRAVGTQSQALVDVDVVNLKEKDILLLCTDGLNSVLSDEEICNIVTSSTTVTQSSSTLVNCAAQRGGQDNITAIVVFVDSL
jgi:serine/threonine protein phosphatase PrpC